MIEQSRVVGSAILLALATLFAHPARGAVDFVVNGTDSPDPVATLSNLTYTLTITNTGTTAATGVGITNVLSPGVNFVSVTTTRGTCSHVSGVVLCDWTTVNGGTGGRVTITTRPNQPGPITNAVSVGATQADANPENNALSLTTLAVNRRTFTSPDFIQVEDVLANIASPYPSTITVSGLTAAVHKVTVKLNNLSHTGPDDLDILLVGPQGGYVMLMSDAQTEPPLVDVTVTFDDAAALPVPDNGLLSGTFRPANYGSVADIMPEPAPPGPHFLGFTNLAIFNGSDPNGEWHLYVYDDEPEAGGWIDGWSLTISTLEPIANLGVSVADAPDPAVPGATVTYTTTITNAGPAGGTGVWVTNQTPAGMEVISYSSSRGVCVNSGGTIRCDLGAMPAQTSEQLVVQVRAASGSYTNRAALGGQQLDPQLANNSAAQTTVVEPRVDLAVDVTSSRTPALLEQPLIFTLALTNAGPDTATGVRVVNELPPGVVLVNASTTHGSCTNQGGIVTCHLGAMASQERASVLLTCRPTGLGPITNLVSVTSDQVDSNLANNSAQAVNTVDPAADLQLTITDAPDPVPVGRPFTYSIFLTNRGPNVASNIVISDVLPASLNLVSVQTTHGACTNQGNSITCAIDQLPAGERPVITITVVSGTVGGVANVASVAGQPVDPNNANNSAAAITLVTPVADISVTKAGERPLIWQGDRLMYTLVISNQGPNTATGARLNDALPAGMSLISATASAGSCALQGSIVACALGELAPGNSATVTIVGAAGIPGLATNTANALANEQDLNPSNNTAVAITTVILRTATVSDSTPISLPEVGASPVYPLMLNVTGMTAAVERVRVNLWNLSHSFPDDLDILLVGPGGQAVAIMSDAGGNGRFTNINLTLDDAAIVTLPDSLALSTGVYLPADYEAVPNEFPAPAPAGPYGNTFEVFAGTDPNGIWKLYIVDDIVKDAGILGGGWSLDFSTGDPLADLEISAQAIPEIVAVGSNMTFAVTVSNRGPGSASAVVISNSYPSDLVFAGANTTQGSCTNDTGVVWCDLGELGNGTSTVVQFSFTAGASGFYSNRFSVFTAAVDGHLANNSAVASYAVADPPIILEHPRDQSVAAGGTATLNVTASGTAPLSYQWFHNDAPLPGASTATLVLSNVQFENLGFYQVQVSNLVGSMWSDTADVSFPRPPVIAAIPDQITGEDQTFTVPLLIFDPDNPLETFVLSAISDDTNLVPVTNLTFTVSGTNYALVIMPATNLFGTNLITVIAADSGGVIASRTFTLAIQSINDYPEFISTIGDQVIDEDEVLELPFIIGDLESFAILAVGHTSHNLALVPANGVTFSGVNSSNRTVTVRPAPNQSGTALIELRIRDQGGARATNFFNLTVLSVEDAPTLSVLEDITVAEDNELNVSFSIDDVETAPAALRLWAESSNTNLLANESLTLEGTNTARTLRALPGAHQFGTSQITLFVEDEAGLVISNAFWLTVDPVNDLPTLSAIPEVVTAMDEPSAPVDFTVGDVESAAESLPLTALSTNLALAPLEGIEFGGDGSNRTVRVVPGAGQFGWTVLQVQVDDGDGGVTTRQLELTVHQTNGPPVIALQPMSQVVHLGSAFTLRVVATGPGPLLYQWQHDGQDLDGQTNATIAVTSSAGSDRGEYRVIITNGEGSVTSAIAQVAILEGTRILSLTRIVDTVELTFRTVVGQSYFVEFQDSLGPAWTALPAVDGTGGIVTATDPAATGNIRLYRVRVE